MTYVPFAMARQAVRAGKGIRVDAALRVLATEGDARARRIMLDGPGLVYWVHGLLVRL